MYDRHEPPLARGDDRLPLEVGPAYLVALAQGVVGRDREHDFSFEQLEHVQVGVVGHLVHEPQVGLIVQDVLYALAGAVLTDLDVYPGVLFTEPVERPQREVLGLGHAQGDDVDAHFCALGPLPAPAALPPTTRTH